MMSIYNLKKLLLWFPYKRDKSCFSDILGSCFIYIYNLHNNHVIKYNVRVCFLCISFSMGLMLQFGCSGSHFHNHSHGISGGSHSHSGGLHVPLHYNDMDDQTAIIQDQYTALEEDSMHNSIQVGI